MGHDTIGAIQFMAVKGALTPRGETLKDISRPGLDGHEFVKQGARAPVSQLFTVLDVANAAAVATHVNACVALKGTLVTVEDGHANTYLLVAVLNVEQMGTANLVLTPVGGVNGGSYLVRMRWTMQPTA